MVRLFGRPAWLLICGVLAASAFTASLHAQGAMALGLVYDDAGKPVEGATVTIVMTTTSRKYEVKTNSKGEYMQIGLAPGPYSISAAKDKLASPPQTVSVSGNRPGRANFVLGLAAAALTAAAAEEAKAMGEKLVALFEEGVAAGEAGNHDAAIAKFTEAAAVNPNCHDCYNNIGFAHIQKKEYDQAAAAYKRATEISPNDPAGYEGLANAYNALRKFDLAAEASAKVTELSGGAGAAGGGGSAESHFNQGVILWNGGKVAEAKKAFEAAIAADPNHAESHYQLGMALVNEGALPGAAAEFEKYLQLAPEGPNAATAKSLLGQLKQ
jgi:tetratricopeptide (TPR) repeat protein